LDEAEGNRIADAQRDDPHADIFFLDHHGVTVGGESIAVAFDDLYYLERASRQQVLAQSTGLPLKIMPEETVQTTYRQMEQLRVPSAELHFKALLHKHSLDS
ncbi:MAG: aldolase/adducin, partial [Rhodospirillales bacterium]|nr:aldolase/adducin [Rhodospirillales bacterium]